MGVPIDADLAVSRLGPPLEHELANWFPAAEIVERVAQYRALYPTYAIEPSLALPGARDAIQAVREAGGRAIVVTAKNEPHAKLHLSHLGIDPDAVIGGLWAEGKAEALREHGAGVYVGDHTGDVRGAAHAGALSVAVATGPCDATELKAAGADVVLTDLTEFRAWWRRIGASGPAPSRPWPGGAARRSSAARRRPRRGIRRPSACTRRTRSAGTGRCRGRAARP